MVFSNAFPTHSHGLFTDCSVCCGSTLGPTLVMLRGLTVVTARVHVVLNIYIMSPN